MKKWIAILMLIAAIIGAAWYFLDKNKREPSYNLVFISIDTLRADHLGCYGYRPVSSNIDAIAAQGVMCTQVYVQVPLTFPSHTSIFTGTSPSFHGIRDNNWYRMPEIPTMASILHSYGYRTAAVVSSATVSGDKGLSRGFDVYDDVAYLKYGGENTGHVPERKAKDSVKLAIEQLQKFRETPDTPFFLWLHLFDPHAQYSPPSPFCEKYVDNLYDGEIAYTDHCLQALFSRLPDNTLVVITADHGEGLGEHGEQSHGYFLYNSTLHVPLIFWLPGKIPPGKISAPLRSIDIMPTTLSLLGVENHGVAQGIDFAKCLTDPKHDPVWKDLPVYAESYFAQHAFGWREVKSMAIGEYKYLATRKGELYHLTSDPGEVDNLLISNTAIALPKAKELSKALDHFLQESSTRSFAPTIENPQMEGLGYFSYPACGNSLATFPSEQANNPDPSEMAEVLTMFVKAQTCLWERRDAQATKMFRQIIERDQNNATCWALLGKLYARQNRLKEAERTFREFYYRLRPHLRIARNGLVDVLIRQRKYREAERVIRQTHLFSTQAKGYEKLDTNAISHLRAEFAKKGKFLATIVPIVENPGKRWKIVDGSADYALVKYKDRLNVFALHIDESDELLLSLLAYVKLERRQFSHAIKWAKKAVLAPNPPPGAYFYLGKAFQAQEKFNKAISAYRNALRLKPDWPEACYLCGECYGKTGNFPAAKSMWSKLDAFEQKDPYACFYRGKAFNEQTKYAEAALSFDRAASLLGNWPEARYYQGLSLWRGKSPLAVQAWDSLFRMPTGAVVYFYQGMALKARQQYLQAIVKFRAAIELRPQWVQAYYHYGMCLWKTGNKSSAKQIWQRILPEMTPKDPFRKNILGLLEK